MDTRLCLLIAVALPAAVHAEEVRGTLSSLLSGRRDARNGDLVAVMPLYELASLEVLGLDVPGFDATSVVLQGWGRLQFGDDTRKPDSADLNLLYVESRAGPLQLRLGRQHMIQGPARMSLIDGVTTRLDIGRGLSAQAHLGANVYPALRMRSGSWQAGGRVAYNLVSFGELGVSYMQRREDSELQRHGLALDGLGLVGPVQLTALAVVDPGEQRLAEARLVALVRPRLDLDALVEIERAIPDLFLPLNSIFSVFTDVVRDAAGVSSTWDLSPYNALRGSFHALFLDNRYLGYRATAHATTYREVSHRSFIGVALRRVDEVDNGYAHGRLYTGLQLLENLRAAADAHAYLFDERINGARQSFLGYASVTYDVTAQTRLAATLSAGVTPWEELRTEAMLRFAYGYNVDLSGFERP